MLLRVLATGNGAVEREKWKGKRGVLFKGKGKMNPKGKFGPEKEKGDHSGEE
jgi:hypothetical protein